MLASALTFGSTSPLLKPDARFESAEKPDCAALTIPGTCFAVLTICARFGPETFREPPPEEEEVGAAGRFLGGGGGGR